MPHQPGTTFVYVLTSDRDVLYTGVSSDLPRRMAEQRLGLVEGFTSRYKVHRLVGHVETNDIQAAIAREKPMNPRFDDLSQVITP